VHLCIDGLNCAGEVEKEHPVKGSGGERLAFRYFEGGSRRGSGGWGVGGKKAEGAGAEIGIKKEVDHKLKKKGPKVVWAIAKGPRRIE